MDPNKIFAISAFINGITALSLSVVVLFGAKKNFANRIFSLFAFFIFLWSLGYYFWLSSETYEGANFWISILNLGSTFIPITYYHWIVTVLDKKRRPLIILGYVLTFIFALFASSKFFYSELISISGFNYWPVAGPLYPYYVAILYGGFFFMGLFDIISSFIKETGEKRTMIKFILAASLISLISGASNFPLWFGIEIPPYGNFIVFVHVFLFSYAMSRYNLMNMKTMSMQIAIGFITIVALIEIIVSDSVQEFLMRVFLFIIIIFFSFLLIRSSRETEEQKVELEKLTKKLERNNEKLKALDRAKNEFISITAHQLRTPPTVIKGYITLAQEDPNNKLDDETKESLERALISNERLIDLVEDILNVSRIESGNMKYDVKEGQVFEDILDELYDAFSLKAKDKGINLILNKPKNPLPEASMDRKKIREVVSNLVDNAVKYTRKGSVEITAKEKGGNIRIEIKDSGVGITKDDMPELFKKFSRGNDPGRLGAEGTGLGIFVGKKIIEDHGGKIWAESDGPNKGSTFIIEVPINSEEAKKFISENGKTGLSEKTKEKEAEEFVEEL